MKNGLYLLVFLIGMSVFGQAKDIDFDTGSPLKGGFGGIKGSTDSSFYALRINEEGILYLFEYDFNLKKIQSEKVSGICFGNSCEATDKKYEFVRQDTNGQLHLFYSELENDQNYLYKLKLDNAELEFGEKEKILTQKTWNRKIEPRSKYTIVESEDKSHYSILSSTWGKRQYRVVVNTYNDLDELLWTAETFEEIYAYGIYPFINSEHINLSNKGILNLMLRKMVGNKIFHNVYSFNNTQSKPIVKGLSYDGLAIDGAQQFYANDDKELRIIGFLKHRKKGISSTKYLSLDPVSLRVLIDESKPLDAKDKMKMLVSKQTDNTADLTEGDEYYEKRFSKGKNIEMRFSYGNSYQFQHADKSITMIYEQGYSAYFNPSIGDLVFINFSSEGDVNWIKNYEKNQESTSPLFLSYYSTMVNDDIYFFYTNFEKGDLTMTTLEFEETEFMSQRATAIGGKSDPSKQLTMIPLFTEKVKDDTFVGLAVYNGRYQLIKFTLE